MAEISDTLKKTSEMIAGYVSYTMSEGQRHPKITHKKLKMLYYSAFVKDTDYQLVDQIINWLVKELDDETAMKYLRKPSPDLPDDTVIVVFYKDVWKIFELRKYQDSLIKKMYSEKLHGKLRPLVITMAYYKQFSYWEQSVDNINAFFNQLKKRSHDTSLVEIIKTAQVDLTDNTVLVKIYGDIWKKGPLFSVPW